MTTKQMIVELRTKKPWLSYREIAELAGCSKSWVGAFCHEAGLGRWRGKKQKDWTPEYLRVRAEHPEWSYRKVAAYLGANHSTLYRIERRHFPGHRDSIVALGEAAARAGLTLQQIEAMADARHS